MIFEIFFCEHLGFHPPNVRSCHFQEANFLQWCAETEPFAKFYFSLKGLWGTHVFYKGLFAWPCINVLQRFSCELGPVFTVEANQL